MTPLAGRLVTGTLGYDGGRPVTAYVPPAPPRFVMFAGDGPSIALGLRHPGVYGTVFGASPGGGYRPPAVLPKPLPRA
ncbi:hypothetical protein [Amycolatopsis sp. NBC_00438]|uniref:hypothetical protein n=1 Tax=Amycolatopsis sp. NBC_00438 TaxID=2903558 RepID=UPI002E1B764B